MSETIGFIGVGLMGHGMAKCIVEKGYKLTILGHRNRAPVDDLVKRGATEAKTAREVAAASSIVFLCVTGAAEVEANVRGADGLAAGAKPGLVIVDCSTTDPTSTLTTSSPFEFTEFPRSWSRPTLVSATARAARISSPCRSTASRRGSSRTWRPWGIATWTPTISSRCAFTESPPIMSGTSVRRA